MIDVALAERAVIDRFNQAPLHPDVVHCGEPLVFANGYPMSWAAPAVRFETFNNFNIGACDSVETVWVGGRQVARAQLAARE